MRLAVRPSKTFLWSRLDRDLQNITAPVGLDAASASFKSYPYFRTEQYYGLDLDLEALKAGTSLYLSPVGLHGSLTEFTLPENSVDLVVSTNTFGHLDFAQRAIALEKLSQVVNSRGFFLLELDNDEFLSRGAAILNQYFSTIETTYYQNPISFRYESIWEKNGFLGDHPVAGSRPFLLLSYFISRFEFLTCKKPAVNRHAYIKCSGKKTTSRDREFTLAGRERINERIFKV